MRQSSGGYASTYAFLDSPLIQKIRAEVFDHDIGQHSWTTVTELDEFLVDLELTESGRLLDFGCGPGGPLTYLVMNADVTATGIELDADALRLAKNRADQYGVAEKIEFQQVDANRELPLDNETFDAAISVDVVMHLIDRKDVFADIARVLKTHGRLLLTDAGIVAGQVSNEQVQRRSYNGFSQYVADGFNEAALRTAGFELLKKEENSQSPIDICNRRFTARTRYKTELIDMLGRDAFDREQAYLETMVELYSSRALIRYRYLCRKV
ncbi:MAG: class I SAM-dependent methyltransferase [Gammaproteobacteria bacterium]|nr:class I SAM-dependent methyltransferase [Gammaproteobacteria bacterium]MDH3465464.1 class I SAM-dependent methyltransferase [Gammaproteobacteria bacterium]